MGEKGQEGEKKGFFKKLFEKLDKKLEEKAKKTDCGCNSEKKNGDSCCG